LLHLGNDELTLTLLDPVEDEGRLGTRYVSGCYVYQIDDTKLGPLFSGPAYPDDPPPVFDGQGLPEAFRSTMDPVDGRGIVFGNAIVVDDGSRSREKQVLERCSWSVDQDQERRLRMSTTQRFGDRALNLHREIVLSGRKITSTTRMQNIGTLPLPLTWFAHPFFPWPEDGVCCRFSCDINLPDNAGFRINADGFIERIAGHDWSRGVFVQVDGVKGHLIEAAMRHPTAVEITVQGDFPMSAMPIWGNARTVSFEPYLEDTVAPDAEVEWSLSYVV